jgi:ribosomal protein L28
MGLAQPRKLSFLVQAQKHDPQTKKKERKSKRVFHLNLKPITPITQRRNPKIKVKI